VIESPLMPLPSERYRHYKGGTYEVLSLARHTETAEVMVVYRSLEHGTLWARPMSMFGETVYHDGCHQERFKRI
jgi:hypothetical protein